MTSLLQSKECREQCANALRWDRWPSLTDWAQAKIVLPTNTPAPGPLNIDGVTPYARFVLDCILNPWTRKVTLIAGSQMMKTLMEIIFYCYVIDQVPTNVLSLMGRESDAKEIATERFKKVILASPDLAGYVTNEKMQITQTKISLNGATIFFGSAGVAAELSQRSIEFGIADETHLYKDSVSGEGAVLSLLDARLSNYPGSVRIDTSTPTNERAVSWVEYLKGSEHVWREPCPYCHEYQFPIMPQIKHPDGVSDNQKIGSDSLAWYECEHCQARIDEHDKLEMLSKGKWISSKGIARPSHYSFHISGISSPWRTYSEIKMSFMEKKVDGEELRSHMNTVCGVNFEDRKAGLNKEALKIATADDGSLLRGQVPDEAVSFAIGCDWHGLRKGLFWMAVAFSVGEYGPEAWIVDYGNVFSEQELLEATLLRDWQTVSGAHVQANIGVDCRWESSDVYEYCRADRRRLKPVMGDDKNFAAGSAPIREVIVDYTNKKTGKRYSGFKCLHVRTGYYKDRLAKMLKQIFDHRDKPAGDTDDVEEHEDTGSNMVDEYNPRFHLCRNADDELIKHLSSEHRIVVKKVEGWHPKKEGAENHLLDCFVYAWAIAELHGLARMSKKLKRHKDQAKTAHRKVPKKKGGGYLRGRGENWSRRR